MLEQQFCKKSCLENWLIHKILHVCEMLKCEFHLWITLDSHGVLGSPYILLLLCLIIAKTHKSDCNQNLTSTQHNHIHYMKQGGELLLFLVRNYNWIWHFPRKPRTQFCLILNQSIVFLIKSVKGLIRDHCHLISKWVYTFENIN